MIINIFTDPHLNVSRQAHTTPSSSKELNKRLFEAAMGCKVEGIPNYIAGDLFDKSFNPEWAIAQGIAVSSNCYVLAGNHDETNREGTLCSLEVVEAALMCDVIRTGSVGGTHWVKTDEGVYMVPHHSSQELFLESVMEAAEDSKGEGTLMVHCNRGEVMGPYPDSVLVITQELEDELLKSFKRIFYGHEHGSHSNKVVGSEVISRAVVLGNTHPTSFSDISDKYRYRYEVETDILTRHKVWSKEDRYLLLQLGDEIPVGLDLDFIEVKGTGSRRETTEYIDALWKAYPNTLMVRPNVEFAEDVVASVTISEPVNLSESIAKDLEGTEMKDLFLTILGTINHGN